MQALNRNPNFLACVTQSAPPPQGIKPYSGAAEIRAINKYGELIVTIKDHIKLQRYNLIQEVLGRTNRLLSFDMTRTA
jgi:hypothetical protein